MNTEISGSSAITVYPLAFPKGTKYQCELCQKPANRICQYCRVTYYCDIEHQESDWYGIHEKICSSLPFIRKPLPFMPSDEERRQLDSELEAKKKQLIEYTRSVALRYLFEGKNDKAIPGAMMSLKLAISMYGIRSVELVPSYLLLGEASQGLGNYVQAQEYLSQAEWTVIKNPDCPLSILSKLHRNIAMLQMAQQNYDDALRNLANDIYYASEESGTESIKASGGYFLMANIFFKLENMDVADSLYRQVTKMWQEHLKQVIDEKTQISELETILGTVDDDNIEKEVIELAVEAEARKILYAIYELRKNETNQDNVELNRIEHCLAMVHFLGKEYQKVYEFHETSMKSSEFNEQSKNEFSKMINFIESRMK